MHLNFMHSCIIKICFNFWLNHKSSTMLFFTECNFCKVLLHISCEYKFYCFCIGFSVWLHCICTSFWWYWTWNQWNWQRSLSVFCSCTGCSFKWNLWTFISSKVYLLSNRYSLFFFSFHNFFLYCQHVWKCFGLCENLCHT